MAYRMTYQVNIDWIGPGLGPIGSPGFIGQGAGGNAQTLFFVNKAGGQSIAGSGTGGIITGTEVTTLTNAMAVDIAAQMNAQPALGQMQGFASGQP